MGDTLNMREDGSVEIGWGDFSVTLREPDIGEWLSFEQEATRANDWVRGEPVEDGEPTPRTVRDAAEGGPFLALYERLIRELGGPKGGDLPALPPWLAAGNVYSRISAWWSANPLSRREAASQMPTSSR